MNRRKEKQKAKKRLATRFERSNEKLVTEAKERDREAWKATVAAAGSVERVSLNILPPRSYKKPAKPTIVRDREPWETIVIGGNDRLVKLSRLSRHTGLKLNLPQYGFTFSFGKWVRYERNNNE